LWSHSDEAAMKPVFVVDCATISCFMDDHENITNTRLKQNPKVFFISLINPSQFL
jgi:hypothetical protein